MTIKTGDKRFTKAFMAGLGCTLKGNTLIVRKYIFFKLPADFNTTFEHF
jgi:hypothetical protein